MEISAIIFTLVTHFISNTHGFVYQSTSVMNHEMTQLRVGRVESDEHSMPLQLASLFSIYEEDHLRYSKLRKGNHSFFLLETNIEDDVAKKSKEYLHSRLFSVFGYNAKGKSSFLDKAEILIFTIGSTVTIPFSGVFMQNPEAFVYFNIVGHIILFIGDKIAHDGLAFALKSSIKKSFFQYEHVNHSKKTMLFVVPSKLYRKVVRLLEMDGYNLVKMNKNKGFDGLKAYIENNFISLRNLDFDFTELELIES